MYAKRQLSTINRTLHSYLLGRRELVVDRQVLDGVVPEHLVPDAVLLPDVEQRLRQQPLPPQGQLGGGEGGADRRRVRRRQSSTG